jgi:hypothetical protein
MKTIPWRRILVAVLGVAVLAAVVAAMLPDNEYQRFSSLEKTIQTRLRWIYERTHYDPTSIDVAFLGPSRAGAAISAPRVEAALAARGVEARVVNFSLPENGRDLHWLIEEQLLATKTPRLLVIAVTEKPGRYGHPAFKYVAPASDVIDPAYVGNLTWAGNLIYLPYRQLRLFAARLFPHGFDLPDRFVPERYAGRSVETTGSFRAGDGFFVERNRRVSRAELLAGKARYEAGVQPPLLGRRFADQEFGAERTYVRRMVAAAQARGIKVAFVFLPYFEGPAEIQERALYDAAGPLFDAHFVSRHDKWFSDVAHLNRDGAIVLSDWLAEKLVPILKEPKP